MGDEDSEDSEDSEDYPDDALNLDAIEGLGYLGEAMRHISIPAPEPLPETLERG